MSKAQWQGSKFWRTRGQVTQSILLRWLVKAAMLPTDLSVAEAALHRMKKPFKTVRAGGENSVLDFQVPKDSVFS